MPRPALLPAPEWENIHGTGLDWPAWLAAAEDANKAQRMQESFDTLQVPEAAALVLASVKKPVNVVAIAEDWCGDVVRHAPVLARLAAETTKLNVRFITRMAYPDVFIRFLTNGGEAIPKFVFLSDAWVECGNWGPMQTNCRELIARGKACGDVAAARKLVKLIYESDPACSQVFSELAELAELAGSASVE